jgi:hypothetical protein
MHRGVRTTPPFPTCERPASNCGLTSSTRSASSVVHRASAGAHGQRDERQIGRAQVDPPVDVLGREITDVGPLEDRHPRVGSKRPRQLTAPDVHRDDVRGPLAAGNP